MSWTEFPRTLDHLPADAQEAWLFESPAARQSAERRLGIKLRSAYKTLLHEVLERGLLRGAESASIRCPVVEGDDPDRFRLECYPLSDLVATRIRYEMVPHLGDGLPCYHILRDDGKTHDVPVPVRWREVAGCVALGRLATQNIAKAICNRI